MHIDKRTKQSIIHTMSEEKKYYYSEIFHSIQGEGHYTGVPTTWLRFFGCNLECNGKIIATASGVWKILRNKSLPK